MQRITPLNPSQLLTVKQAAGWLNVSVRTVYRLLEGGKLGRVKVGRLNRIPASDISLFLENSKQKANNNPHAGLHDKGEESCQAYKARTALAKEKTVPTIGHLSPTQAAKELDALLKQKT